MLAGHQTKDVDPRILATLRKYRFIRTDVDDCQGIVTFGHYHLRRWDDYIWAKNGLTEPTSMPSTITESDIEDWTDLRRAGTNQGISRHLNITVGPDILDRLQTGANSDVVEETRSTVLTALNQQRLAASRLVEVPEITYEEWRGYFQKETGLHIDGIYISDSFWEGRLLKQLLSEGVLTLATDGRHLKIKPDLTDKQRLQTEWLHVGIMNHAYGNLLAKRQYQFQKELGDNWYFNQS
jgi:hypothetical protein